MMYRLLNELLKHPVFRRYSNTIVNQTYFFENFDQCEVIKIK